MVLIATDLDRTLIPNGPQPESPGARPAFRRVAAREDVRLAYVTGRHLESVRAAIREWELPEPAYVIADVGTTIYSPSGDGWVPWASWVEVLSASWPENARERLRAAGKAVEGLREQEAGRQGPFKLSYEAPPATDPSPWVRPLRARAEEEGIGANLIWSVDAGTGVGLLDVLPAAATKRHALEHVMERDGFAPEQVLFAGDSGNDLDVLVSGIPSVLVANAASEVRIQAMARARKAGTLDQCYFARGAVAGMNGNYAAGILEGLARFHPELGVGREDGP